MFERAFDNEVMLDVAIRKADGTTSVDLGHRAAPPLPVHGALGEVLPTGLRRGSTVAVSGSISLLLATLGAASADGAWCALVGFPPISAEAAVEYGIELSRLAIIPAPGAGWTTAVGALLDALDVVAARPPRLVPGDIRRLAARARTREAVLMPYTDQWPGADVRLRAAARPVGRHRRRVRAAARAAPRRARRGPRPGRPSPLGDAVAARTRRRRPRRRPGRAGDRAGGLAGRRP